MWFFTAAEEWKKPSNDGESKVYVDINIVLIGFVQYSVELIITGIFFTLCLNRKISTG